MLKWKVKSIRFWVVSKDDKAASIAANKDLSIVLGDYAVEILVSSISY